MPFMSYGNLNKQISDCTQPPILFDLSPLFQHPGIQALATRFIKCTHDGEVMSVSAPELDRPVEDNWE
jgi:hypothetical protein